MRTSLETDPVQLRSVEMALLKNERSLLLPKQICPSSQNNLNAETNIIAEIMLHFDECQGLSIQSCYARGFMPSYLGLLHMLTFEHNGI